VDSDRAAGMWKEMKGKVKQQRGKLTDDDLKQLEGPQRTACREASGAIRSG
jgi:uncharacterized protein YjbJ (UPF0337 family)